MLCDYHMLISDKSAAIIRPGSFDFAVAVCICATLYGSITGDLQPLYHDPLHGNMDRFIH